MDMMIDDSQQRAARAAGLSYLLSFAIVVYVNFAIHDKLIVDSAAETARNILAHERLFRVGIVGDILYCTGVVVLLTALYVILRPVSRGLALLATFGRLVFALMWLAVTLKLFDALRIIKDNDSVQALGMDRAGALATLYISSRADYYYVGLLFGAAASTICGYLWLKSRYIPKALAVFGLIASAFCVACTLIFYVFPGFQGIVNLWWFDTPMALFDIVLSFWLLIRGLKPVAAAKQA